MRRVETAVSEGSSSNFTASQIRFGSVFVRGPPRNRASTTSSKEVRKAKAPPEITAGRTAGRTTCQKARGKRAPQERAASSRLGLRRRNAAPAMTITTGSARSVWPRKRAAGVPISRAAREQHVEAERENDDGHDHRRDQEELDGLAAGKRPFAKPVGGGHAEDERCGCDATCEPQGEASGLAPGAACPERRYQRPDQRWVESRTASCR